tara:strand:+ start:104303 stop:105655 length:1353 start_codon:yes stop_codon:yes gene_type:complete
MDMVKPPLHPIQAPIKGFSRLSKEEKINYIIKTYLNDEASVSEEEAKKLLQSFWHSDDDLQKTLDEFSENTVSNFAFPFGVAPNVLINDHLYCVPMVIEESSVVAAASKAAKFWLERGGFKAEVISTVKSGQVHLKWNGPKEEFLNLFESAKEELFESLAPIEVNMKKRGGGVKEISLVDKTDILEGYYQIWADFETCDAMGANFINTVLEALGKEWEAIVNRDLKEGDIQIIMAILSNYTSDCLVRAWVECPIEDLAEKGIDPVEFAQKFKNSVDIATLDVHRATTHNKGIMNGIDSVVLATGNDFRAVEACAHAYAARDGQYRSLTRCSIEDDTFLFEITIPLSLGTVGGLTSLHPMAKLSLDILGRPNAKELMEITAVIGLAQNFAALRSLTTTGIQKGHMKMHLMNILNHLQANEEEREKAKVKFSEEVISFKGVSDFITQLRQYQ